MHARTTLREAVPSGWFQRIGLLGNSVNSETQSLWNDEIVLIGKSTCRVFLPQEVSRLGRKVL